jgi:DNA-binding transcriptional ArsR family regulator
MGATHESIIDKQAGQYNSEWIVVKEATVGKYRFDILAFNPITKETEITEVDVHNITDSQKEDFAKSIGKYRKVTCKHNDNEIIYSPIEALAHVQRVIIVEALEKNGLLTYSELLNYVPLKDKQQSGQFVYHLKMLLGAGLIDICGKKYYLTNMGNEMLHILKQIDKISCDITNEKQKLEVYSQN